MVHLTPSMKQLKLPASSRQLCPLSTRSVLKRQAVLRPRQIHRIRASPETDPSSEEAQAVDEAKSEQTELEVPPSGTAYVDELPQQQRTELSSSMKERMRKEYLGLGGSENTPMGANYFLWIIVIISALAVASWLSGAI